MIFINAEALQTPASLYFLLLTSLFATLACQNPAEVGDETSHLDEILSLWERYLTLHSASAFGSDDPELMNMLQRPARMIHSPVIQILYTWLWSRVGRRKLDPCTTSPKTANV
ncbi:MAG: hypothetical protein OXF06_01695 [Bacteroidetes bacterium]|nr:hypothetical protein [Bacteroidota bacterium]